MYLHSVIFGSTVMLEELTGATPSAKSETLNVENLDSAKPAIGSDESAENPL